MLRDAITEVIQARYMYFDSTPSSTALKSLQSFYESALWAPDERCRMFLYLPLGVVGIFVLRSVLSTVTKKRKYASARLLGGLPAPFTNPRGDVWI